MQWVGGGVRAAARVVGSETAVQVTALNDLQRPAVRERDVGVTV